MTRIPSTSLDYYNRQIITRIVEKYGMSVMDAAKSFLCSETHAMLENAELAMWEFPEWALFEMWEAERITGDPRNSIHLRSESA